MLDRHSRYVACAGALAIVGLAAPAARALTWNSQVVDATPHRTPGLESSLAIDPDGRLHIAYLEGSHEAVKYARTSPAGTAMRIETVDDVGRVGDGVSLALAASGAANLLFFRNPEVGGMGDLVHARRRCLFPPDLGCSWIKTTLAAGVHSPLTDGSNTAIAIDGAGTIHGAYVDNAHGQLRYLRNDTTGWSSTIVTSLASGSSVSIAADANNLPQLAFTDNTAASHPQVRYARVGCVFVLCGWQIETIDEGHDAVIKIASTGQVSVAYKQDGDVRLARRLCDGRSGACTWSSELVAADVGSSAVALALGSSGGPQIAFYGGNHELRYARRGLSGSWTVELADPMGALFEGLSMVVDGGGIVAISYFDVTNNDLRLARGGGPVVFPGFPLPFPPIALP